MRLKRLVTAALATTVVAGLIAAPGTASARPEYEIQVQDYIVDTKFGKIFVQVAHPVDGKGKIVRGPAIFTYSPYSLLGAPPYFRRNNDAAEWVPQGYHRVWADVIGTGNSGGCYDYGGDREKVTGAQLVEWIARQKWSTGKVGMMGGSYEGTTATATAVMNPKGLTTIVPEAAISRWYGYAYSGGIRYTLNNENPADEGLDTPLAFDFGFAAPPPTDAQNAGWQDRVASSTTPCEEVEHTQHGYDDTPDYDKFWLERDYLKDADKIDIPVLVSHNWGDWNVKQEEGWNLFHALKNSPKKVLYMGHRYLTHSDAPSPGYSKFVHQWMDHYLKGVDNGIQNAPTYITQSATFDGPGKRYAANRINTTPVSLIAQVVPQTSAEDYHSRLLVDKPRRGPNSDPVSFPSAGVNLESHMNHHGRVNHEWWYFESLPLKQDTRIFGQIKVQVYSSIDREWVTLTPTIVDAKPACHRYVATQHVSEPNCLPRNLYSVTRGFLDTRYRNGLSKQAPLPGGEKPFSATVVQKPQDYTFKKGHSIGLQIATEINEWAIPKPYPCQSDACTRLSVHWAEGKTRVILPVVGNVGNPEDLFEMGGHHHH